MPDHDAPEEIQPDQEPEPEPEQVPQPEPEPVPLAPVAQRERIAVMDVLRGIAVFGIFLINMPLFVAPSSGFFNWEQNTLWSAPADRLATLFIYIFAQGKFYTLFSFLFGLGFGVQLLRAADRHSPDFNSRYRRRLTVLLILGILHFTLVWWGDVLHVYALLGFLLFLFRERTDKTLFIWVACLTFIPLTLALIGTTYQAYFDKTPAAEKQKKKAEREQKQKKRIDEDLKTKSTGTFPQILLLRLRNDLRQLGGEVGWATELFANFLLGLWASRRRILQDPASHLPLLKRLAFLVLPLGLAFTIADLTWGYLHPGQDWPLWRQHTNLIREFLARPAIAFGYAAVLILIGVRSWMSPYAAVGRMALTNYLLHSLVFTTIANSYGLGLYGKVPPLQGLIWCVCFYALQIPFSVWWLRRHNYGPAEWAWRSLTYGARQPWLRPAPNSL